MVACDDFLRSDVVLDSRLQPEAAAQQSLLSKRRSYGTGSRAATTDAAGTGTDAAGTDGPRAAMVRVFLARCPPKKLF